MNRPIRIIALTEAGHRLAATLQQHLSNADMWYKPKPFTEKVQQAFLKGDALVMICATGIAIRSLAPVINSKHEDPPLVVIDEQGKFVIPLLSGHEGGANDWANNIANTLQAQLVMTTAKPYLQPIYTIGMGCEFNCPEEELKILLMNCLKQAGLTLEQVHSINSIDIKADEQGLITLAESLEKPYRTFNKQVLSTVAHLLSTKSEYVFETVGVYGVAESAALWAAKLVAREDVIPELVLNKEKNLKATCAIARAYPELR